MERVNRHGVRAGGEQASQPVAQLGRGAPREGDGQACSGGNVSPGDDVREPMRKGSGLSRARAGDDQERPADGFGGGALVGVERAQDAGGCGALRRPARHLRALGGRRAHARLLGHCRRRAPLPALQARRIEQQPARGQPLELAILEQADDAVFAVIPRFADHVAGPQSRDRLGEQRGLRARDLLDGRGPENPQLGAERPDQPVVAARDGLAGSAARENLGEHLGERHEIYDLARGRRRLRLGAVGERLDPVQHADRRRLAAHRTAPAVGARLRGQEPRAAFAVAVEVIFALLREELDRADVARSRPQRVADREIIERAVERCGLATELGRRMRVGIGDQPIAVEQREPPIHRRVRGQAGLDRKNMLGQLGIAFGDRVEARLRAQCREPRRPDVRRHQIGVRACLERDLKQIVGVESQDRPAVGGDIADAGKSGGDAIDGGKIGRVDQVMDFAGAVGLLVDRRDLDREQEPDGRAARGRELGGDRFFDIAVETKQAGLRGNEFLLELGNPRGMREVAGRDHADALAARPIGEMLEIEIPARGTRIFGVDVQIRMEAHRTSRACAGPRRPAAIRVKSICGTIRRVQSRRGESLWKPVRRPQPNERSTA
jgi:hypothetical protein